MISRLPVGPIDIPTLGMGPCDSLTSRIEARLASPSASALALSFTKVPALIHADRPLELELVAVGLGTGAGAAVSTASWISAHALLQISVEVPRQYRGEVSLPVTVRPSASGSG